MRQPLLEIVAGPNGSGKSTFAESFLVAFKGRKNYLNPDLISAAVSPGANVAGLFTAGRILLQQIDEHLFQHSDIAFESTLSGRTYLKVLQRAKAEGYFIRIYFLYLRSSRINLARVKRRVQLGGHNVPRIDVLRRFPRSYLNFWNHYRLLADDWILADNTQPRPVFTLSKTRFESLDKHDQAAFAKTFTKGKVDLHAKD